MHTALRRSPVTQRLGQWSALFLVLLVWLGGRAGAHADSQADGLFREGTRLRKEGRDREAVKVFERLAEVEPQAPRTAAALGAAYQAIGDWLKAERWLDRALRAQDDPFVERNRASLADGLAFVRKQLARLELTGGPSGAQVILEGRVIATLPLRKPVTILPGRLLLEVRHPGFRPMKRYIDVPPGTLHSLPVDLAPEVSPPPPHGSSPGRREGHGEHLRLVRALAFTGVGLTAASLGLAIGGQVVWNQRGRRYRRDCQPVFPDAGTAAEMTCRSDFAAATTARSLAIAGWALTGAFAVTTTLLFVLPARHRGHEPTRAFACGAGPGVIGLGCRGAF